MSEDLPYSINAVCTDYIMGFFLNILHCMRLNKYGTMDFVKGRTRAKSRRYAHQCREREELIMLPGCRDKTVTPSLCSRALRALAKRMLHSLEWL